MSTELDYRQQDGHEWEYRIPETSPAAPLGANLGYLAISLDKFEGFVDPKDETRKRYQRSNGRQDHGTKSQIRQQGLAGLRRAYDKEERRDTKEILEQIEKRQLAGELADEIHEPHVDLSKLLEENEDGPQVDWDGSPFPDHEVVDSAESEEYSAHRQFILAEQDPDYDLDDLDDPNTPNYDPYGAWEAAGPGVVFEADSAMWARKKERSRKNPDYMTDPEEDYSDYLDGFHITTRP